jgi:serine/threonine protein kinase
MIYNEINFLRELRICENIVQLERCYTAWDQESCTKTIALVMKFAKYGTILKHLQKKEKFTEEEIRTIMA